jgi:hypothetical protein
MLGHEYAGPNVELFDATGFVKSLRKLRTRVPIRQNRPAFPAGKSEEV